MEKFETRDRVVHTSIIFKRLEDNVVLQFEKGGVKLDKALTRDRL